MPQVRADDSAKNGPSARKGMSAGLEDSVASLAGMRRGFCFGGSLVVPRGRLLVDPRRNAPGLADLTDEASAAVIAVFDARPSLDPASTVREHLAGAALARRS